jgi:hypothetical protein
MFPKIVFFPWRAILALSDLKSASLGQAPALPANIRLGWKSLSGKNTLALISNYGRKKFYNTGPRRRWTGPRRRRRRRSLRKNTLGRRWTSNFADSSIPRSLPTCRRPTCRSRKSASDQRTPPKPEPFRLVSYLVTFENNDTWGQCYKTIFVHNLQVFTLR